jgi:hypothetical protein
MQQEEKKKN